jgi:AcrR family transcriptional regulator
MALTSVYGNHCHERYAARMARTPLTERRKAQTRRDIAEAAIGLFMRQGYETVSVEAIAEEAGVSERTLYRYFATKDDVLSPIITEGTAELAGLIATRPAGEPIATAVHRAFAQTSGGVDQAQVQALIRLLITVPALHARWLNELLAIEDALVPTITSRIEVDVTQAHLTAAAIVTAMRVTLERSARTESKIPLADDLADALRYLSDGANLRREPAASSRRAAT